MYNEDIRRLFDEDDDTLIGELLNHWDLSEIVLIGKYTEVTGENFGFFNDVKSEDGITLSYPFGLGSVSVYVINITLQDGKIYKFNAQLSRSRERIKKRNPFLLQADQERSITEFDQPKKWVEQLFQEIGQTNTDAGIISRALKKIAGDLYTEAERFVFELLQNADDIPNATGRVHIKFILLENYLAVLHDGKPFNNREVQAISNIGDTTKSGDASKTGYKGIGFKSVFTDSECVYIHSGHFCFRYDKNYYNDPEQTPWEIKPIWTELCDLPQEIQSYSDFFTYPVSIALKVSSSKINEYRSRIRELFNEPRFMLFLRHVSLINVEGLSKGLGISLKLNRMGNCSQISYNHNIKSQWLVKDIEFDVPQEVQEKIKKDDSKVPAKLKNAKRSKLSFAAQIKDCKLVHLSPQESVLFTYLPTDVKDYQFPFLVNADFLTTANRQDIHKDNDWNLFIFECIAYHSFEFLKWISSSQAGEEYKKYLTDIIPKKLSINREIGQAFNKGFDKGVAEIAFIPSDETDVLLKVSEAIIDETKITTIIDRNLIKSCLGIQNKFVSSNLETPVNLKELGVEALGFAQLRSFFSSKQFQKLVTPEINVQILMHLKRMGYGNQLSQVPIILDEQGNLRQSSSTSPIYFQPSQEDKALLTFDSFYFIHPELDRASQQEPELRKLLISLLNVKEFRGIDIIKERISRGNYQATKNTLIDHVNYVRFIFKYRRQLTDTNRSSLGNLKIIYQCQSNYCLTPASKCYLSDYYRPKYCLEGIANIIGSENLKFIISDYCVESDIDSWKEFFISIGIIKPDGLDIIRSTIIPLIDENNVTIDNALSITRFLFSVLGVTPIGDSDIKTKLGNLPLKSSDELKPVGECYLSEFYSSTSEEPDFLTNVIIPNLVSNEYCSGNENPDDWRQFFINIGVTELQGVELVRKKISLLKDNPDIVNKDNAIQVVREIFRHHDELSQSDFANLLQLKLFLKNGQFARANICYFANEYNPKQDLESLFRHTDFNKIVSPSYLKKDDNVQKWRNFLIKIGVSDEIRFFIQTERDSIPFNSHHFSYLSFIGIRSLTASQNQISYEFENFVAIYHSKYFSILDFSQKAWKYIVDNWDRLNLDRESTVWIDNRSRRIPSYFKFIVTQKPSIPCTDNQCRKPSEVYSRSLQSVLKDCNLPVSAVQFRADIENFIGLKNSLDVQACLTILDSISKNGSPDSNRDRLDTVYQRLCKILQRDLKDEDRLLINEWKQRSQLLACDDHFHPISELYYIDPKLNLPSKRNSMLVNFPDITKEDFDFEVLLSALNIEMIDSIELSDNSIESSEELPKLIKEKIIYLGIYLAVYQSEEARDYQKQQIVSSLNQVNFYNPGNLYVFAEKINYSEPISNYYKPNHKSIYYVGKWNSRKNSRLGEYIITALELDKKKITSERLLDFLDDSTEEVVKYLRDSGFDVPDPEPEELEDTDIKDAGSRTIVKNDDGTGNNPKYWGAFGEACATIFYEQLGYTTTRQPDGTGYDFHCLKSGSEIYSEVKAISSGNEAIRITMNEWSCMCREETQQKYELLVVVHADKSVQQIIRVKSAWLVLQQVLSQLSRQRSTPAIYNSGNVEVLIGFQLNSKNQSNDVILNWKKLLEDASGLNRNIEVHQPRIDSVQLECLIKKILSRQN